MLKSPGGAINLWQRFPKESVNSTAGTPGEITYSSRAIHCCQPLRGRIINRNGVSTGILNSSRQEAFSHISIHSIYCLLCALSGKLFLTYLSIWIFYFRDATSSFPGDRVLRSDQMGAGARQAQSKTVIRYA